MTSQHGMTYARLRNTHGKDGARTYGAANERAKERIADLVEAEAIDCDFRRRDAYLYARAGERRKIEREAPPPRRPGCRPSCSTTCRFRSRPTGRCASATRPSSTRRSTCSPSPT